MAMTKKDDTCEKQRRWLDRTQRVKKRKSLHRKDRVKKNKSLPPPCNKCDSCLTNKQNKVRYEKWKERARHNNDNYTEMVLVNDTCEKDMTFAVLRVYA